MVRDGKGRWERQPKVAPRRTGVVGQSDARPERVSRSLPSSLSFFSSSLLPPFPLSSWLSFAVCGCRPDGAQFKRPTPSLDPAALGRCNCNRTNAINLFRPRPRHPQTASSPFAMHLRQLLSREHARRRRPLQPSCSDDAASSPWHPSWSQPASQHPPPPSQPLTM